MFIYIFIYMYLENKKKISIHKYLSTIMSNLNFFQVVKTSFIFKVFAFREQLNTIKELNNEKFVTMKNLCLFKKYIEI